jgi:hypothetical protein
LTLIITFLLTALCFSKHVDRLSKYGIVDESSTIFFAGIDAQMKMLAGLGSFFFFGEEIDWPIIVGFLLIAASVVIMVLDKMMKQKKLEKEKQFMDLKNQLQEELADEELLADAVMKGDATENPIIRREITAINTMANVINNTNTPHQYPDNYYGPRYSNDKPKHNNIY